MQVRHIDKHLPMHNSSILIFCRDSFRHYYKIDRCPLLIISGTAFCCERFTPSSSQYEFRCGLDISKYLTAPKHCLFTRKFGINQFHTRIQKSLHISDHIKKNPIRFCSYQ